MLTFLRSFLFFLTALSLVPSAVADNQASPAAAPAFVNVVIFSVKSDGPAHKMVVTTSPTLVRVDEPDEGYSVIYDSRADHYIGLEHRNYTWWEFSWGDVRSAVESSKRYAARMGELNLAGDDGGAPSTNAAPSSSVEGDSSGYVWHQGSEKKRIAGFDCILWTGDTLSGDSVQAWCYNGPVPQLQAAMDQLRKINEPLALVPIRELVPPLVFPVCQGLSKNGVTPLALSWGDRDNGGRFALVESETHNGNANLFSVPKLYIRTTLVTMDGMIDQSR